jgi:hypothetical protein
VSRASGVYSLYGLACASPLRLPAPKPSPEVKPDIAFLPGDAADFAAVRPPAPTRDWFRSRRLPDGSVYLCWTGVFEFLVSANGRRIWYRALPRASRESFKNYLLTHVLSFSLLALGREHLHGTAVMIDDAAVAILGMPGHGKSTLGAALLARGYPLVTDDLVALSWRRGKYWIEPGVPRIKLFPSMARALLGTTAGPAMLRGTSKLILPLGARQTVQRRVPLTAIYVLVPPRRSTRRIGIRARTPRAAMLDVVAHTFNTMVTDPKRLARQFAFARDVTRHVPVASLSYPRRRALLPDVCDAIVADVRRARPAGPSGGSAAFGSARR